MKRNVYFGNGISTKKEQILIKTTVFRIFHKKKGTDRMTSKKSRIQINSFFKLLGGLVVTSFLLVGIWNNTGSKEVYSQVGSSGNEVEAIQKFLKDWGLFNGEITGYYGNQTEEAVKKFQKQRGLPQTGICDDATLKAMGITIGARPTATQSNINLLARIISAEGRGEPYIGQVAIGAVICNRVEHPSFPDTISGVIYENGAFTALVDGQFNEPIAESAYAAARDCLSGWDPTGGAIYYYNPKKTNNAFIKSRPVIKQIGDHLFCE